MARTRRRHGTILEASVRGMLGLASGLLLQGCLASSPGLEPAAPAATAGPAGDSLGNFVVASLGAPPGTIAPTRCVSGDHQLFLGADLVDPGTNLVVRLVVDPLDGPALRIYDAEAPFDRSVLFFRDECTTFAMELEETGWIVNDIIVRRLVLEVDCENEDGAAIRGRASADRCN